VPAASVHFIGFSSWQHESRLARGAPISAAMLAGGWPVTVEIRLAPGDAALLE